MAIYELQSRIQKYSWGDPDLLPAFTGRHNPNREPWAELWYGAHPSAPSKVRSPDGEKIGLDELIDRDAEAILGAGNDGSLPFMVKVLAVAKPLSLQVHPSRSKAVRGYARESMSMLPMEASDRNYTDGRHKPEFVVALDRFEGACGFRPPEEMLYIMRLVSAGEWESYLGKLLGQPSKMEMAMLFYSFISVEQNIRGRLLRSARARIDRILESAPPASIEAKALGWIPALMDLFPDDMATLSPIMLNTFDMDPGQGLYVAPGQPHVYFRGCALEVMANSDNEVRAGLTHKRTDLTEFIGLLNFESAPLSFSTPGGPACGKPTGSMCAYDIDSDDFSLAVLRSAAEGMQVRRRAVPEILLCVEGPVRISASAGRSFELKRGRALFVDAAEGDYSVNGKGMLFSAAAGRRAPAGCSS